MNFWKAIIGLTICCCMTAVFDLSAQIEALNADGEKILVYPDGSWKYADAKKEEARQAQLNPQPKPNKNKPAKKSKKVKEAAYTKAEMVMARKNIAAAFRNAKDEKEDAIMNRWKTEQELKDYMAEKKADIKNKTITPQEKKSYDTRVKFLKGKIKRLKKTAKKARKREKRWQSLLTKSADKMMAGYHKKQKQIEKELGTMAYQPKGSDKKKDKKKDKGSKMTPQEQAKADYEKKLAEIRKQAEKETAEKLSIARLRSKSLEKYLTPTPPPEGACRMAFDEIDPLTGKRKRAVKAGRLFSHVNEENEAILKGKGYISCDAFISEVNDGKDVILVLDFTILSKDGYEEFGGLPKGAKLGMVMLDESKIILKNREGDKGRVDAALGRTKIRGYYNLSKSDVKDLEDGELNFIRVYWGNGFEDYEILAMNFFRDQLRCLNNTK